MGNFRKLMSKFKELNLPNEECFIYGSGPLGVREIREVNDLDVFVTDDLYKKLKKKYPQSVKEDKIEVGEIEIYPPSGWNWRDKMGDLETVMRRAEIIDGVRFMNLEDLIVLKKEMGRQKDFEDIGLIKNYLREREEGSEEEEDSSTSKVKPGSAEERISDMGHVVFEEVRAKEEGNSKRVKKQG